MGKIVCDVCGTSYPETGTQCPICGCVRPADINTILSASDEAEERQSGTYTYVKGGRFSKANVKKRNQGKEVASVEPVKQPSEGEKKPQQKNDAWFVVTIIALLVAIVAVVIYIAIRFFVPALNAVNQPNVDTTPSTTEQTVGTTEATEATIGAILCEEILLNKSEITFDRSGAAIFLKATAVPENTTDDLFFVSNNDGVVTVSADGRVTAVGPGTTTITVICGSVEATCEIICDFDGQATEATTEPSTVPEETTAPVVAAEFTLNREDFTLTFKGETWDLYDGEIPADQIKWTTNDEKVATIKDGVVTAVGAGYTYVHGEYNGAKLSCKVICSDAVGKPDANGTVTESGAAAQGPFKISNTDVSLQFVGDKFTLKLLDANNQIVIVSWQVADPTICSVDGNLITGIAPGRTNVYVTVDGNTYTCIVRVKS